MLRFVVGTMMLALCFVAQDAYSQQRGRGEKPGGEKPGAKGAEPQEKKAGEKPGGEARGGSKPPGGAWSENKKPTGNQPRESEPERNRNPQASGAESAAERGVRNKPNQPSGAEGAAAGAAAANRNKPAASGAEGAAVGVAASRNKPAASGAEGAALGAAAVNHNPPNYAAVRSSFNHPEVYNRQWYADHDGAWAPAAWTNGNVWTATSLAAVTSHCAYGNTKAVSYGYGDNVTYQEGNIIIDGQNVGTAEDFSQAAADLAIVGQDAATADADDWLPLGVFALVRDEDQHPQLTVQLAINKQGILRGNYNDIVIDHVLPIHGSVDKQTRRAAWTVNNNKNFFMEAGISNLTSGEAPTLIHKSGRTERWLLVRLSQPGSQQ